MQVIGSFYLSICLFILYIFHIMHPKPIHLPVPVYLSSAFALVTSPHQKIK